MTRNKEHKEEKPPLDLWLGRFPAVIGAGSALLLLMTIIYEWGYFGVLGAPFQSLMTATDYLTNAIYWIPIFLLAEK
jgi:hypothetical protein